MRLGALSSALRGLRAEELPRLPGVV